MALAHARPEITRAHLLRAASQQAVAHYVAATGDTAILDESVTFLEGPRLEGPEHDTFFLPTIADESASLFEHCTRGLDQSLIVGRHGLRSPPPSR